MDRTSPSDLDELVAAIWGLPAAVRPQTVDPKTRVHQNEALAIAIRAYLQSYLDDLEGPTRPALLPS